MSGKGVLRILPNDHLQFWCGGCKTNHSVGRGWSFNGDYDKPTFSPSVLVTSGHYASGHEGSCWCTYNVEHPENPSRFTCQRCHSFVTDGNIQYLDDCTHALRGQTVPLQEQDNDYT